MMAQDESVKLREVARAHQIDVTVGERRVGPSVTAYGLIPDGGTKPKRLEALVDSWSLAVGKPVRYRGVSGAYVIVEVPNDEREPVGLADMGAWSQSDDLVIPLGVGTEGSFNATLKSLPHLLVAGASGQGKSVYLNALLVSLLRQAGPDRLQLALVDPKRVELAAYADLPHLIRPIARSASEALDLLKHVAKEMDRRYEAMERVGVKHAHDLDGGYGPTPPLVVIVDELADLMMAGGKSVESLLVRIASVGRAAGVHLIVATQYPKREVITPLVKQNMPSQIAFTTNDAQASRLIVGVSGAEQLTGKGDALVSLAGHVGVTRVQAPMVSDEEIRDVVARWVEAATPVVEDPVVDEGVDLYEEVYHFEDIVKDYAKLAPATSSESKPRKKPKKEKVEVPACHCDPDLPRKYAALERRVRELETLGRQMDAFMRAASAMIPTGGK
jgi:S-DNA-T family DNA segregation ATPase FtsK/SpoIIIE